MAGQAERPRDECGQHRRSIADHEQSVNGLALEGGHDDVSRPRLLVIPDGNRPITPRILQLIASIGGVDQLDSQLLRRLGEHAGLISGGRCEQQYSFHAGVEPEGRSKTKASNCNRELKL
jgi:hypothetical protein